MKTLSVLLVLLSVAFATAPSWVAQGVSLNYTSGGNIISFTVTGTSGGNVGIMLNTSSPSSSHSFNENASLLSGQFWFDQSSLSHSYQGELLNGLTVTGVGQQSFAGKTWDTVTLQGMVSGSQMTKIYDGKTGLLLKQSVEAAGIPDVVLSEYYIPALSAPPQQNTTTPSPQPNATNSSTTPPPVPQDNSTTVAPQDNSTDNSSIAPDNVQLPDDNSTLLGAGDPNALPSGDIAVPSDQSSPTPCCPSTFILLLAGFVALRAR